MLMKRWAVACTVFMNRFITPVVTSSTCAPVSSVAVPGEGRGRQKYADEAMGGSLHRVREQIQKAARTAEVATSTMRRSIVSIPQEANSKRMGKQSRVMGVPKISCQETSRFSLSGCAVDHEVFRREA